MRPVSLSRLRPFIAPIVNGAPSRASTTPQCTAMGSTNIATVDSRPVFFFDIDNCVCDGMRTILYTIVDNPIC